LNRTDLFNVVLPVTPMSHPRLFRRFLLARHITDQERQEEMMRTSMPVPTRCRGTAGTTPVNRFRTACTSPVS